MGKERELSEGEMEDDGGVEDDTTDSLDIKPPQAQRAEKKHKKKTSKEKKHGKHKHRRSDEDRLAERYEGDAKYHRRDRGNYVDYFQHPSRPGREPHQQMQRYEHRDRSGGDYVNYKQGRQQYQGHQGRQPQQPQQQQQRYDRQERHHQPHQEERHHHRQPETRRRPQTPEEEDADKILSDLRYKLLMKKNKHDELEAKEEKKKHRKEKKEEDEELLARRARILEADREKERRKEAAIEELEARRGKRREKEKSDSESPKKRRTDSPKRNKDDEDIVMVSDHSEETDSESDSKSGNSESEESQHSKESFEVELPGSPLSVGDLSKSERRRRSDSQQKQVLRSSRSLSGSATEHSGSESESSHSDSRSRSPSESPEKRRRSVSRSPERSESPKKEGPKTPESPKDSKKDEEIEEELPPYFPAIQGCRSVEEFQCLNRIEEGTYGVVYRAKDKRTEEIVALKRLKMEKEKEGFPITSLREINTILKGQHPNIVTVREIVVGSNMDKIFIVMDYVEHDLKSLMETMKHKKQMFLPGEVKCLLQQLLRAVAHLHDNWILHRDLKTSNLLLSHKGILKVGDFGLAREYGSPLKPYTPIVVTLWYRAPELLLGCKEYSIPIDVWSVGCIFAEFLSMQPLFPGKSEVDQLNRIFKDLGTPNERIWPGYSELPAVQRMTFTDQPVSNLRKKFSKYTSELGLALLQGLLTYDPKQRLSAEKALHSTYFTELPLPIDPAMFPTWPAKSELGLKKALASSPKPPSGGTEFKRLGEEVNDPPGFVLAGVTYAESRQLQMGPGFSLRF